MLSGVDIDLHRADVNGTTIDIYFLIKDYVQ